MAEDKVDKLIEEIETEKAARQHEEQAIRSALRVDKETAARVQQERQAKISGFQLQLDLDEEFAQPEAAAVGAAPASAADPEAEPGEPSEAELPQTDNAESAEPSPFSVEESDEPGPDEESEAAGDREDTEEGKEAEPKKSKTGGKKKVKGRFGCLKGIIYGVVVLGVSIVLAYFAITGVIDVIGLNKSDKNVDIEIPQGASTQQVAEILHENGLIDQPLIFRLYSKFTKADGTYQPGTFTLQASMGYGDLIENLQNAKPRESVSVMVPEGSTIEEIGELLEEKEVCTANDFYLAVVNGDYSSYDFVQQLPDTSPGSDHEGRIYMLEGYLFPDTYEFYTNSAAETVVKKFLDNFGKRVDASIRAAIKAKGMTLDEAIIMASIIQGEAASQEDMVAVSRVLYNRLENKAEYPKLECDSTRDYVNALYPVEGLTITNTAYDTYKRAGLPVGAINNPGLQAIEAAIYPSEDAEIGKCYFFATDYDTGITYFSKTLKEHERICRKYGIGMYG